MENDIHKLRNNYWDYMSSNSKRYIELCTSNNYIREEQKLQDVESLINKGNKKITEFRTNLQRESQNS
jgi:hypothetical protein